MNAADIRQMARKDWINCYMGLRDAIWAVPERQRGALDGLYLSTFNALQAQYLSSTYGEKAARLNS